MGKSMKSLARISEDRLKLIDFLELQSVGSFLTYAQIEEETGVIMNKKGKDSLRKALSNLEIVHTVVIGKGIELASPDTAVGILSQRFGEVSRSICKAEKTHRAINDQFYDDLSEQDRKSVVLAGAAFAMMHSMAKDNSLNLLKPDISNTKTYNIEIPKI